MPQHRNQVVARVHMFPGHDVIISNALCDGILPRSEVPAQPPGNSRIGRDEDGNHPAIFDYTAPFFKRQMRPVNMLKHMSCDQAIKAVVRVTHSLAAVRFIQQLLPEPAMQFALGNFERFSIRIGQHILIKAMPDKAQVFACPCADLQNLCKVIAFVELLLQQAMACPHHGRLQGTRIIGLVINTR